MALFCWWWCAFSWRGQPQIAVQQSLLLKAGKDWLRVVLMCWRRASLNDTQHITRGYSSTAVYSEDSWCASGFEMLFKFSVLFRFCTSV